ncbi:DUF3570 domain-containing protein [Kaarinaea lacus]
MQLKPKSKPAKKSQQSRPVKCIRESLALATCSLLATTPSPSTAEEYQAPWEIDSSLLIYQEKDRVSAYKPMLGLRKETGDDEFLNIRLVADVLTGASPNGAAPQDTPQTFSSPSGESTYTTKANEIPLDDSFEDTRGSISFEWEKPVNETLKRILGFNFSLEQDYTSLGFASTFSKDINRKHTTLTAGASVNFDRVDPQGSTPKGLSTMPTAAFPAPPGDDDDDDDEGEEGFSLFEGEPKNVGELMMGVTQIINRYSLTQLNYSIGRSSGYLNDPYKIVTVLENDGSGDLRTTDSPYLYENRPDSRTYQSIYWKGIHQFGNEDVITVSYRYFWDDWDITSHTVDLRYRWELGGGHYLQPHVRHYQQTAASFYRQTIIDGEENNLDYVSADYRLGEFTTDTIGLKYGISFDSGAEINIRVESIKQRGETRKQDAVGKLRNFNLYPDMDASVIQAGFSVDTDIISKFFEKVFGSK